jgi:hypothetical protein
MPVHQSALQLIELKTQALFQVAGRYAVLFQCLPVGAFGGRAEEARRMIMSSLAYNPKQRVSGLPDLLPFYGRAQMDMWSDALHRAGLPD